VKLILYANGLLLWVVGCFCCIHLYAEGVIQTSITLPVTKISPPPPPYEDFCRREPEACLLDGPATIGFTPTNVELMTKIGAQVNSEISFSMDTDQYFQEDFWSLPHSGKGDCEDIALEKRQRLAMLGFPRAALRIAIVFHKGYLCPHALLTIETDRGTYVLDFFLMKYTPGTNSHIILHPERESMGNGSILIKTPGRLNRLPAYLQYQPPELMALT